MVDPDSLSSLNARIERLEKLLDRASSDDQRSRDTPRWSADQVKEYIQAVFVEKDRALSMADRERELSAAALRGEQQRAMDQASDEREKAASALRVELARAIDEGDERLREHITNQIMQIQSALVAADKLETERVDGLRQSDASIRAAVETLREERDRAQSKFEVSVERRFTQVNEFRGALDDLSKQMATRREVETAVTNLTESVEKARQERQHQIDDLRATLVELRSRLDVGAPQIPELQAFVAANTGRREGIGISGTVLAGGLAAVATIITIVVILANVFTTP